MIQIEEFDEFDDFFFEFVVIEVEVEVVVLVVKCFKVVVVLEGFYMVVLKGSKSE